MFKYCKTIRSEYPYCATLHFFLILVYYRTLRGEIKGKSYFKFHKVHSQPANSTLLPTKSALFVQ